MSAGRGLALRVLGEGVVLRWRVVRSDGRRRYLDELAVRLGGSGAEMVAGGVGVEAKRMGAWISEMMALICC